MRKVIVDLFCGAGGFSLGFKQVFPEAIFIGMDFNLTACLSYAKNISKNVYCVELKKSSLEWVINEINGRFGKIDYLIGSPPCQGFSTANRFKDLDTTLVELYLEIKRRLNPLYWVMEEVPAVGKIGEKKGWFGARYLKACEFNLPHVRKRLFAGNYPNPIKNRFDGLKWESEDKKHSTEYIPTPSTSGFMTFSYDRKCGYPSTENLKRLLSTPVASIRGYGHGKENREKIKNDFLLLRSNNLHDGKFNEIVSPELCAYVMGFPSCYIFLGTKTEQYRQIGNAVCPPVSRAIALAIKNGKRLLTLDEL